MAQGNTPTSLSSVALIGTEVFNLEYNEILCVDFSYAGHIDCGEKRRLQESSCGSVILLSTTVRVCEDTTLQYSDHVLAGQAHKDVTLGHLSLLSVRARLLWSVPLSWQSRSRDTV